MGDNHSLYPSNVTTESELIHCCGEWLESDYPSEDQFFIGLLFWKSNTAVGDLRRLGEANFHNIGHHIADLVKDTTGVVSTCTTHLNKMSFESTTPQQFDASPTPIAMQFETNHPVFQAPVKPEYNVNELTFSGNKDQLHLESMRQARQTPPQIYHGRERQETFLRALMANFEQVCIKAIKELISVPFHTKASHLYISCTLVLYNPAYFLLLRQSEIYRCALQD